MLFVEELWSYHRRLRMIAEALELYVEDGRVSHTWCICVVYHGYSRLDGGRDGGGGWYACGTKPWGWLHVERCRITSRVRGDALMTHAALGMVEPKLVSLVGKVLTRDATRRLRLVVNAAGWLHSMMLHGRIY